jgi:tRNA threonylcarbamoyladenosine biosynthesis protein TsaB
MTLLLSIETSTHSFSCALHQDGNLIAFEESITEQSTASMLAATIDKLFRDTQCKKNQLNGVIVSSGPGSYTGLRIGVATAKGICYALSIPLISINTLYLMAHQAKNALVTGDALLCPMLDARRMEVYCALFDKSLNVIEPTQAKVIDDTSFAEHLNQGPIIFFGEGSDKCQAMIKHSNAKFISAVKPAASILGEVGFQKFGKGDFEDLEHFEPFYLKDFIIKKPNSVS